MMQAHNKRSINVALVCELAVGMVLVGINTLRIRNIPITFDECDSWDLIRRNLWDILLHFEGSANNHMLNTFLQKIFTGLLGDNLFALRMDNLLAQVMFLVYSAMIAGRLFKSAGWQVSAFLLLNLHPFLFEFWGLGRGYGLAIAFMAGSLYHMIAYVQREKLQALIIAAFLAALSVLSNFVMLNYYCAMVGVVMVLPMLYSKSRTGVQLAKAATVMVVMSAALYILVAVPIKNLRDANLLFYGGEKGFVADTIGSLVRYTLHTTNEPLILAIAYVLVAIFFIGGLYWIANLKDEGSRLGVALWLLLAMPVAAVITQHAVLNTKYLTDRTGMFLIVLYMLHLVYWLYSLKIHALSVGLRNAVTILVVVVFMVRANVRDLEIWHTDIYSKIVLDRIAREARLRGKQKMCSYWITYPSIRYHAADYLNYMEPPGEIAKAKCSDTTFDYYYLPQFKMKELPAIYKMDTVFPPGIYYKPGEGYYLMKKDRH